MLKKYATVDNYIANFQVDGKLYNDLLAFAKKEELEFTAGEAASSESKIKLLLKAYIGRNLFDDAGFYPVYHEIDDVFQAGLTELEK